MTLDTQAHVAFLDRYYHGQRHIYDASRRVFLFGRERMLSALAMRPGEFVLEVGCGTGRNLFRLAKQTPDAHYYGVDASEQMLAVARDRAPADAGITFRRELAEHMNPGHTFSVSRSFDVVFFSYSLSMMPDWRGALDAAWRMLAAGGRLWIVDFWDFAGYPSWLRSHLTKRLARHHVVFEPGVHDHLRALDGQCTILPVARRWGYIASFVTSGR